MSCDPWRRHSSDDLSLAPMATLDPALHACLRPLLFASNPQLSFVMPLPVLDTATDSLNQVEHRSANSADPINIQPASCRLRSYFDWLAMHWYAVNPWQPLTKPGGCLSQETQLAPKRVCLPHACVSIQRGANDRQAARAGFTGRLRAWEPRQRHRVTTTRRPTLPCLTQGCAIRSSLPIMYPVVPPSDHPLVLPCYIPAACDWGGLLSGVTRFPVRTQAPPPPPWWGWMDDAHPARPIPRSHGPITFPLFRTRTPSSATSTCRFSAPPSHRNLRNTKIKPIRLHFIRSRKPLHSAITTANKF